MNWFGYDLVGIKSVLKIIYYIQYNNNSIVYEYNYFQKLHTKKRVPRLALFFVILTVYK